MNPQIDVLAPFMDAPDDGGQLSQRQTRTLAIRQAAPHASQREIAELADVSLASLERWLTLPFFRSCWDDAALRVKEVSRNLRTDLELRSLRTLVDVQDSEMATPAVKVDAAAKGLTHVQRAREHEAEPERMKLGAMLAKWARAGEELEREAIEGERA